MTFVRWLNRYGCCSPPASSEWTKKKNANFIEHFRYYFAVSSFLLFSVFVQKFRTLFSIIMFCTWIELKSVWARVSEWSANFCMCTLKNRVFQVYYLCNANSMFVDQMKRQAVLQWKEEKRENTQNCNEHLGKTAKELSCTNDKQTFTYNPAKMGGWENAVGEMSNKKWCTANENASSVKIVSGQLCKWNGSKFFLVRPYTYYYAATAAAVT